MASRIRATNSSTCGGQRPPLPDATDIDSQSIGITACGSAAAKRPNDTALGVESSTRIAPILARSGQLQHSIKRSLTPDQRNCPISRVGGYNAGAPEAPGHGWIGAFEPALQHDLQSRTPSVLVALAIARQ